jgi:hypothetical protein
VRFREVVAGFMCVAAVACGAARQEHPLDPTPQASALAAVPCSPFEWAPYEDLSEHAAMLVPVELDGESYTFQLDTGADVTMLYGSTEAGRRGWPEHDGAFVRVDAVRLGGTAMREVRILRKKDHQPGQTAGTVGLDVLTGHVVVLDLPGQRFCVIPPAGVPPAILDGAEFVPAELRDGKLFVRPRANGREMEGIFYDTGASLFPLSVDHHAWQELTGRTGDTEGTVRLEIPSWGRMVPMVGAPLSGALEIGSVRLDQPLVFYWGDQPRFYAEWPFPAAGLLGNMLFLDHVVVLDLRAEPRFGVVR